MEGEEASLCLKSIMRLCGLCLIGKIVPEHCTSILKAVLQKICVWHWKCQISLDIPKIVIYVSIIEFYKGVTQLGGQIDH